MRNVMRILPGFVLLPVLAVAATACGDGTGPDAGEVEMTMRDDPGSTQAALVRDAVIRAVAADPSLAVGGREAVERARIASPSSLQTSFDGVITADANGSVSADGESWVEIGAPSSVTMDLQSNGGTTVHSSTTVQGGTYAHVRLVLRSAQATIRAGSVIGGITLDADVNLTLGGPDSEVVIEKQVSSFEVSSDTRASIVWEMNSEEWADEQNTQDEEVEDSEVQESSDAEARNEPSDRTA